MEKKAALALYIVTVVIIIVLATLYRIRIWSAIVLALIIGLVLLFVLTPQTSLDQLKNECSSEDLAYIAIWVVTILVSLFYILDRALKDRAADSQICLMFNKC